MPRIVRRLRNTFPILDRPTVMAQNNETGTGNDVIVITTTSFIDPSKATEAKNNIDEFADGYGVNVIRSEVIAGDEGTTYYLITDSQPVSMEQAMGVAQDGIAHLKAMEIQDTGIKKVEVKDLSEIPEDI